MNHATWQEEITPRRRGMERKGMTILNMEICPPHVTGKLGRAGGNRIRGNGFKLEKGRF